MASKSQRTWKLGRLAFVMTVVEQVLGDFTGTAGDDVWTGTDANETASGEDGNDTLSGGGGDDVIDGGNGDDILDGGAGADILRGGNGSDTYYIDQFDTIEEMYEDWYADWVYVSFSYTLGANLESLQLLGSDNLDGTGNDLVNQLWGNSGNNVLSGLDNNDFLSGFDGNDILLGGPGLDLLSGDAGDDVLDGGDGSDSASYRFASAGVMVDLMIAGPQDTVGAGVDTLISIEALDGSEFADVLKGDDNLNVFYGVGGADILEGRGGNDQYFVADRSTQVIEQADGGHDQIVSYGSFDAPDYVELLTIISEDGSAVIARGSAQDNGIFASSAISAELYGGAGNDHLYADAGNDFLYGDADDDELWGYAGDDALSGGDGNDTLNADAGDDELIGGDGDDTLYGDAGNDSLDGGVGNDSLFGGPGNDILRAGSGYNLLNGGEGDDVLYDGDGNNNLFGLEGDDTIYVGYGAVSWLEDYVSGGSGYDTLYITSATPGTMYDSPSFRDIEAFIAPTAWFEMSVDDAMQFDHFEAARVDFYYLGKLTAGANFRVSEIRLSPFGNTIDLTNGASIGYTVVGGAKADVIIGGPGDEHLSGQAGNDVVRGGGGDDYVFGGAGDDVLEGQDGNDTIYDESGADILDGGAGTDTFFVDLTNGFSTADRVIGGSEHDTLYLAGTASAGWLDLASFSISGIESFISTLGSFRMSTEQASSFERLEVSALQLATAGSLITGPNFRAYEISLSNSGNLLDLTLASSLNYTVVGGAGNDRIVSSAMGDQLSGGTGADIFEGTKASLDGDTIADFAVGDALIFRDATLDQFQFTLSGDVLAFSGGTLSLAHFQGTLVAGAAAGGGVQLTATAFPALPQRAGDYTGDGLSDILWRHDNGAVIEWLGQADGSFAYNPAISYQLPLDWSYSATGDFNGDFRDDILWREESGTIIEWLGQSDGSFAYNAGATTTIGNEWLVSGAGDFNGDHYDDMLLRSSSGVFTYWLGSASGGLSTSSATYDLGTAWKAEATGDFNGDGRDDLVLRNTDGTIIEWLGQAGGGFAYNPAIAYALPKDWTFAGSGDFNNDLRHDTLWRNGDGALIEWLGQGDGTFAYNEGATYSVGLEWRVTGTGDFNGDHHDDVMWRNEGGTFTVWLGQADGSFTASFASYDLPTNWNVQPDVLL